MKQLYSQENIQFNQGSTSASKSIFGNRLKILELATDIAPTPVSGGPQSINNILNSLRIASSFVNTSEPPSLISETSSSRPTSSITPRINYSHQFGDLFFMGVQFSRGDKYIDERNSISSNGLYIRDRTRPALNEMGIKLGIGPLNYLTDNFSFELSLKYSENSSNGIYDSFQLKFPYIRNSQSIRGYAYSTGDLEFRTKNYSMNSGITVNLTNFINVYLIYDFTLYTGSLKLSSLTQERIITTTSNTSGVALNLSERESFSNEFTFLQTKKGLGNGLTGFNMNFETGLVFKIFEKLGIKIGGFYQLSYYNINEIKGINYRVGGLPIELDSVPDFTFSLTGKKYGDYGFSFGVVKNL